MTRAERITLAAGGIGVLVIMISYGITRLVQSTTETLAGVSDGIHLGGSPFLWIVPWLLIIPAFVYGQVKRGVAHGRGIIVSHFKAIHGMGLALVLLVVALVVLLGGVS